MTEVPLSTKHLVVSDAEEAALLRAFSRRELSGNSDVVAEYEQALSVQFGSHRAVACSSGTTAILLALMAAGVEPGTEVIVSPAAPVMSALPILALGATPVFCDLEGAQSFRLDLDLVPRLVSSRTRAVVSVPMWGYPYDARPLREIADVHGLLLIEDCAHAHGATYGDQRVGAAAHCSTYSTHERKLIATGEGGFVLTDESYIADRLEILRNCGKPQGSKEAFGGKFGLNLRLPGLLAAIGIAQLTHLDSRISVRRQIAVKLRDALVGLRVKELIVPAISAANYYAFCAVAEGENMGRIISKSLASRGILSDTYSYDYRPMYEYPVFSKYRRPCPNAEKVATLLMALPCHENVQDHHISVIRETIEESYGIGS